MAGGSEGGALLQLAGTVAGALIGGAGTLLGSWFAKRTESRAQRILQAEAYQLRIWMELQDALEGIDNALADVLSNKLLTPLKLTNQDNTSASASVYRFRSITLRTRILRARLVDESLVSMASTACEQADRCISSQDPTEFEGLRASFLETVELINRRINALLVGSRQAD